MKKLKNRLDAFADGIMAVIITIMVLDITPVLHDSWPHYSAMAIHIGIYLITFVFVFNMWYQHSTVFAEIDTMTYRILIWEVVFLGLLSLMPLFTDMMAENTTRITVILYGVGQATINFVFRTLAKAIIHLQYTAKEDMQKVYLKIYGNANRWLDLLSGAAIIVAYFFPEVALFFFLAYPILSFLLNADARQQMYDAEALPDDEQKDLAAMPASAYTDWRKASRQIWGNNGAQGKTAQSTANPVDKPAGQDNRPDYRQAGPWQSAKAQFKAPTADDSGRNTEKRESQDTTSANHATDAQAPASGGWSGVLPGNWEHWLNQNVDPDRQRRIEERFENATPEQQERMEQWFKKRRQQVRNHNQHVAAHNAWRAAHPDDEQSRPRQDVTQDANKIKSPQTKDGQDDDTNHHQD
ncbi:TMEM175 family protein [Lacticaseibacillus pabuli]|uniref:TMEM175 family protein n=1 Tax=Lacticaseibacillus pabuli TaxID=3025672 RepID=A0ABY7WMZ3_9LACO|nr:TMEM175 family protein [Lacticaseibacillus sp. KACC 23028]WDF81569.1 TMEM175 family protein [Lacticaseibacillus sp. KACC 23028]